MLAGLMWPKQQLDDEFARVCWKWWERRDINCCNVYIQFVEFFFFLLSLNARNHVDDHSGTLGGVRTTFQLCFILYTFVDPIILCIMRFGLLIGVDT